MNTRALLIGAWCVPVALVLFGISLIPLAHFIPPLQPSLSPELVAAHFREHSLGVRLGMAILLFSATLLVPITAIFALLIRRIEGGAGILSYCQIITGTLSLVEFLLCAVCWSAAAFRPDRSLESIVLLNDLGWLFFVMIISPGMLQVFVLGFAIIKDRRPVPLFPRWIAYLNFWAGVLYIPSGVVALFLTGPFAWNGLIAFWIPLGVFGSWWLVMFLACLKAIPRAAQESNARYVVEEA